MKTSYLRAITLGLAITPLVACQPSLPTVSTPQGTTALTVRVNLSSAMGTKALPKKPEDVEEVEFQLWSTGADGLPDAISGGNDDSQVGAPVVLPVPPGGTFVTHQFMANAGIYYLKADARQSGISIAQPGQISVNTVQITGGSAVYLPSGTELVINLKLLDGTPGTGATTVDMSPPAFIPSNRQYGVSLISQEFGDVDAVLTPARALNLDNIQEGTFDIWAFVADTNDNTAIPAKPKKNGLVVDALGNTSDLNLIWGFNAAAFSTPNALQVFTPAQSLAVGADGTVYYNVGNDIYHLASGTKVNSASSPPTALAIAPDGSGDYYYTDGTDIRRSSDFNVVASASVAPTAIAVTDDDIYYTDGNNIRKANDPTLALATATFGSPAAIAVDRVGNIYYVDGTTVMMKVVYPYTYFGVLRAAGDDVTVIGPVPGANFTGVAVDPAGNVYVTDAGNHRVVMAAAGDGTVFRLAGNSNGNPGLADNGPEARYVPLTEPRGIAISATGEVFITSSDGAAHVLRKID